MIGPFNHYEYLDLDRKIGFKFFVKKNSFFVQKNNYSRHIIGRQFN